MTNKARANQHREPVSGEPGLGSARVITPPTLVLVVSFIITIARLAQIVTSTWRRAS